MQRHTKGATRGVGAVGAGCKGGHSGREKAECSPAHPSSHPTHSCRFLCISFASQVRELGELTGCLRWLFQGHLEQNHPSHPRKSLHIPFTSQAREREECDVCLGKTFPAIPGGAHAFPLLPESGSEGNVPFGGWQPLQEPQRSPHVVMS